MWLFVFIVATFFYLYITIGFRLLDTSKACGEQRGCSPLTEKYEPTNGRSGDFSFKRQKNIPGTTRSPLASKLKIVVD